MSHQGRVHDPGQSPGLIRVITAGYAVNKKNELIFSLPEGKLGSQEGNQSRFVLLNTNHGKFKYGKAVKFNLEKIDDAWKTKLNKEWPGWDKKLSGLLAGTSVSPPFEFKYIATDVQELPEDYILNPFYRFIEDLNIKSSEDVIRKLKEITDDFEFQEPVRVNLKGGNRGITLVKMMEYQEFFSTHGDNTQSKNCFEIDFLTTINVDKEIIAKGHHKMSTEEEVPTRRGH